MINPTAQIQKHTILLVEDDLEVREFYSDFLSEVYIVETAVNGELGLNMLKSSPKKYDLVLLDIMMPKMDGMAFMKEKNKEPSIVGIPVVVLTNLGQEEVLHGCFDLGAKYYILKAEITPDQILPVLKEAIEKGSTTT
jgi:CheY-like chemotaxis protein